MNQHQTHNDETGSLFTGPVRLSVGDAVAIEGEGVVRRVTFVMGSDRNGWRACFAGQGAVPRGQLSWRVGEAGADRHLRPGPRISRRADVWASIPLPSSVRTPRSVLVTGFDSAWTTTNRGAITSCLVGPRGIRPLVPPRAASFAEAAEIIEGAEARAKQPWLHVIVVDQPLIVPNEHGSRPVERALAPIFGRFAGGVQPANRTRLAMFGDDAPIWQFLARMSGSTSPWHPADIDGRVIIESFPALAVLGLFPSVYESGALPKYNPERRRTFSIDDWGALCRSLAGVLTTLRISSAADWCIEASQRTPRKADRDALDSVLCMLVGVLWWAAPSSVLVAGDEQHGYVVAPSHGALEEELRSAGLVRGVPVKRGPGPGTPVTPVGSPVAVLAAVRRAHAASDRDVDALSRRIAEGRKPARYESRLR